MDDTNDGHGVMWFVDPVDDPVRASTCAVSIGQWRSESLPNPAGILEQRADDELAGGEGDCLGKPVGQLTSGGG